MASEHMTKVATVLAVCATGIAGYQWFQNSRDNERLKSLENRLDLAWDEILKLREHHGQGDQS